MSAEYLKITIIKVILLVWISGCLPEMWALECFSCQGINCQRRSKINETATCANKWDECMTIFSGSSVVERGCFTSIPEEHLKKCTGPTSEECHMCFGNLCNNRGAVTCLHCNFKEKKECVKYHCPIPEGDNTYCFQRFGDSGFMESGCLTGLVEQIKCQKDDQCEMCISKPGKACNEDRIVRASGAIGQSSIYGLSIGFSCLLLLFLY